MISADSLTDTSRRNTWWLTIFLTLCFTLSYTDRHVLSLLIEPVKASLHLSDTQMGLAQGLSFSIFYVLASLPLGRLSDGGHRPRIISACIAVWCSMTMLCGFVSNFWQLLLARVGVASSEAGLPPAALTMMADLNDPEHLASRTSVFMLAPFLGGGLALMGGGALYGAVQHWRPVSVVSFATLEPWRLVFVLVGAPGLLAAAAVLLLLREPRAHAGTAPKGFSFAPVIAFLRGDAVFNSFYMLTMAMLVILLNANVSWMPAVLMRTHHVDARTVGLLFGPVFLVFGIIGTLAAGAIIGRSKESVVNRTFRFMRWCVLIALPAASLGPLAPSLWLKLPLVAVTLLCTSSGLALSSLPLLIIAPSEVRAQALAVLALVTALVGTGLGPLLVGVLSDLLRGANQPLSVALAIVGATAALFAALMLHSLVRRSREHYR
jgi:MFS family permease